MNEGLREMKVQTEKHPSIELSDQEHLSKLVPSGHYVKFNKGTKFDDEPLKVSKDMEEAGFVYKPLVEENMSPVLKKKYRLAKKICADTQVIKIEKI